MARTRRNPPRSGAAPSARQPASTPGPRRRGAAASNRNAAAANRNAVPDVYQEMIAETQAPRPTEARTHDAEPPPKRLKRPGQKSQPPKKVEVVPALDVDAGEDEDEEDDDDIEFEDIEIPAPVIQTADFSADEDEDDDIFEDLDLSAMDLESAPVDDKSAVMELNLSAFKAAAPPPKPDRKKVITRAERDRRVEIHKLHLLCLLSHAARRNHWCNDSQVQKSLRPLLTAKMIKYLNPDSKLSQFGQTESLKNGIQQVSAMFQLKFTITERGLRRSLWAESEDHLKNYELADDIDSVLDKDEFREAAKSLRGSRDIGVQLFCALLRSAGVETRLVCSLQPLSFVPGAPTLAKPKKSRLSKYAKAPIPEIYRTKPVESEPITAGSSPMRRQGYHLPQAPPTPSTSHHQKAIKPINSESPFPVYWVEVLDVAHQKWAPVDPLVTQTQWKPARLEPPASDRGNSLAYAIAFSSSQAAKDVTRRYAKAYNSKTRRLRVDSLPTPPHSPSTTSTPPLTGEKWLRRAMRRYASVEQSDLDQIEDIELANIEGREPMPRNVADFKGHPLFALERHLRRHEVITPEAKPAGTVSAGAKAPLERIYRRRDVRVCRTADKWYRMGRVVRADEIPVKWLPRTARKRGIDDEDDQDEVEDDPVLGPGELNGTPLFTPEQTDAYVAPPVKNGVVPKNKFGNIDVYVPGMVPPGGAHVTDDRAPRAAFLLGVDYAPALTGFDFSGETGFHRGRKRGTAVLRGAVVPAETVEAIRVVVEALADVEAEMIATAKSKAAAGMWVKFLRALRIRRRIRVAAEERGEDVDEDDDDVYVDEEEDAEGEGGDDDGDEPDNDIYDDDDGGGGFLLE